MSDVARLLAHYEKSDANYTASRNNHSAGAKGQQVAPDRELKIARSKIRTLKWLGIISGTITLFAVPLSIYLWTLAYDEYCKLHGHNVLLGIICPKNFR
jgi:hypothetical protein